MKFPWRGPYFQVESKDELKSGLCLKDGDDLWQFVRLVEEGEKDANGVPVTNKFKNKWWLKKLGFDNPPVLFCFDQFPIEAPFLSLSESTVQPLASDV